MATILPPAEPAATCPNALDWSKEAQRVDVAGHLEGGDITTLAGWSVTPGWEGVAH